MTRLTLSPAALLDLNVISDYIHRTWGEEQESLYLEAIWQTLEEVRLKPDAYKLRSDLLEGCRSARCGRHVIFFISNGDSVDVIRILHAAMDFHTQLSPG